MESQLDHGFIIIILEKWKLRTPSNVVKSYKFVLYTNRLGQREWLQIQLLILYSV